MYAGEAVLTKNTITEITMHVHGNTEQAGANPCPRHAGQPERSVVMFLKADMLVKMLIC